MEWRRRRGACPRWLLSVTACAALGFLVNPGVRTVRAHVGAPHPFVSTRQDAPAASDVRAARDAVQRAIDAFEAVDLNGRPLSTRDLRGRVVVLDFWATWCAPCLAELPRLQRAHARYGDRLVIVGISLDVVSRATLTGWLRRHRVEWPQVYDGRGWSSPVVGAFGIEAIPSSLLVDSSGRLVGVNVTGERLERSLEALLPGG